jgi:uncharacterized membrane protein
MLYLALGLLLFLGTHSLRIVAEPWRQRTIARIGVPAWRAAYSLVAVAGFVLIIKGYGEPDTLAAPLYELPAWSRLLTIALMLPAAVLLVAAYVPGTRIKQAVGHPMMLATRVWAGAHLLSNGRLADVLLFGSFFAWAVFAHHAARRRDLASGTRYPAQGPARDAIALAVGAAAWGLVLVWAHRWVGGIPLM